MAVRVKRNEDGEEYEHYFYSVEDLARDIKRYQTTPERARARIAEIQIILHKLLDPKLSDAQRCSAVNMLRKRLSWGHRSIEDLAAVSKIAVGRVDPKTHCYVGPRP